jgi:hypothetical protein
MSRGIFGWDLPPGVTQRMIDEAFGIEAPCDVCGKSVDDCICPECETCQSVGDPRCYDGVPARRDPTDAVQLTAGVPSHGLDRTPEQIASFEAFKKAQDDEAAMWAEQEAEADRQREADRIDGYDRDDLGESPDF